MNLDRLKSQKGESTGTIIIFFICLVVFLSVVVRCVDFFQPISKWLEMREICKGELYSISLHGGLTVDERNDLITRLENIGLSNVAVISPVAGAPKVKLGEDIRLRVEADYDYSTITAYLTRTTITENFVYDKTQVQKRLTN